MCILFKSYAKTFILIARSNKIAWMIRQSNQWDIKYRKQILFNPQIDVNNNHLSVH